MYSLRHWCTLFGIDVHDKKTLCHWCTLCHRSGTRRHWYTLFGIDVHGKKTLCHWCTLCHRSGTRRHWCTLFGRAYQGMLLLFYQSWLNMVVYLFVKSMWKWVDLNKHNHKQDIHTTKFWNNTMSMFCSNTAIISFEYTDKCQEKERIIWVKKKLYCGYMSTYTVTLDLLWLFLYATSCVSFHFMCLVGKGTPIEHGKKTKRSVKISSSSLTNKMLYKG